MTQTTPDPTDRAQTTPQAKRHPWHWIVPCVVLALVAVGLGIWALSLNSDLNDQKDANAQLQQQNEATQADVQAVSKQVDDVGNAVSDASDELSKQGADTQKAVEDAISRAQDTIRSLGAKLSDAVKQLSGGEAQSG